MNFQCCIVPGMQNASWNDENTCYGKGLTKQVDNFQKVISAGFQSPQRQKLFLDLFFDRKHLA